MNSPAHFNPSINLLLLTFGPHIENHTQAAFSILSFLKDPLVNKIIVVTDHPNFYQFLGNKVDCILIDEPKLKEWQGEHQFFWRIKIKALEFIQQKYPYEHLLYVDSDTFLVGALTDIYHSLEKGNSVMHKREFIFSNVKNTSNTERKMFSILNGYSFSSIIINEQSAMWNAGVIGLPKQKAEKILSLALTICDDICETACPRRLAEQLSFSLALAHLTELKPCDSLIGHYWGNKQEWNTRICQFLTEAFLKNNSIDDIIKELQLFDWSAIPIIKKERSTNRKIVNVIDKILPPKQVQFFN